MSLSTILFTIVSFFTLYHSIGAIDCFKCVSFNGSNKMCEDPFHNNYSTEILESPCYAGRKSRNGVFPATACIKLSGVFDSGVSMVVRDCALDSGSLTTDTELVRMSHCGAFYFDHRYVSGCVQSCFEDACNTSYTINLPLITFVALIMHNLIFSKLFLTTFIN
ncbi:uncharacterized protein LOC107368726 isoform X2 [Tetranychus urticae]|uniref:uncharacterized protein LOC107368726 isoform X2 n=1 Tax=Tetranychus urticae TaxID=32264 RepID=UPI00077BE394|nr:uncharacterized protein LOC107368726 isoform X2 [Tetranychus urticae]